MFRRTMFRWSRMAALGLVLAPGAALAQHWQFDRAPGENLEIRLRTGGGITIQGGGSGVTIDAAVSGRDKARVQVMAVATADGVRVSSEVSGNQRNTSADVDLTITVPDRFDVDLETMGGDIRITGVEGRLDGQTMGGAIVLHEVRGEVTLNTMGGKIQVTDSEADGKVSTMGGNVEFHNVRGGLKGTSMGGLVTIDDSDGIGAGAGNVVRISTMGGPIHVKTAPAGAEVSTMGGNVTIESAGGPVDASTMGGRIEIGEASSDVTASTMGGDVVVRMVGSGGDVDIESKGGTIELTLPSGFAADFDLELAYTRNSKRAYEIRSDFPVQQRQSNDWSYEQGSPRKYIYGKGSTGAAHQVKVRTVNGNVVIHQGG
ncbi:MAG: DUF4097 domain-containing protein [Thermoanaerobaculia bacterium]